MTLTDFEEPENEDTCVVIRSIHRALVWLGDLGMFTLLHSHSH